MLTKIKNNILFVFILLSILLFPLSIYSKTDLKGPGLGIIVGEPTGISLKYGNFPIIGVAWSLENRFSLHLDYWMFNETLKGPVNWFAGIGGKYSYFSSDKDKKKYNDEKHGLGLRIPLGLQYYIIKNLELFGEVVPGISLIPSTAFDVDAGIGLRYYF